MADGVVCAGAIVLTSIFLAACGTDHDDGPTHASTPDGAAGSAQGGAGGSGGPSTNPADVVAVPLTGCLGVHTAEVTVGGSQTFHLIIDSGSQPVAIAGSSCSSCAAAGVSPLYSPGPTAIDRGQKASALYGTGDHGWTGEIYQDTFQFPGLPPVAVDFVSIETQASFFFPTWCLPNGYQGIFGLARGIGTGPVAGTDNYLTNLAATGVVQDSFAVQFCDHSGGTLWLGGVDQDAILAPPEYTALLPPKSGMPVYEVDLADIALAGVPLESPSGPYGAAIFDTGSDSIYLPEPLFTALTTAIGQDAVFQQVVPEGALWFTTANLSNCTLLDKTKAELDAELPRLTLTFGLDSKISVDAPATESYLVAVDGIAPTTCWIPGIATLPNWSYLIIGVSFLRSRITIFDREQGRLGFARQRLCL